MCCLWQKGAAGKQGEELAQIWASPEKPQGWQVKACEGVDGSRARMSVSVCQGELGPRSLAWRTGGQDAMWAVPSLWRQRDQGQDSQHTDCSWAQLLEARATQCGRQPALREDGIGMSLGLPHIPPHSRHNRHLW